MKLEIVSDSEMVLYDEESDIGYEPTNSLYLIVEDYTVSWDKDDLIVRAVRKGVDD